MPAIMVGRIADNPVPDSPGKWLAGEIVSIVEEDHLFGYKEMPLRIGPDLSVEQINAADPANIDIYQTTRVTNSGVITFGNTPDLGVFTGDVLVNQRNDVMTSYGNRVDTSPGGFFHILVTDRTVEEVNIYLEAFNKKLQYTSDQFDPGTDLRRFTTTNIRVSASGNNGFTAQGITDAIDNWNDQYPANAVTLVDTDNLTFFQCDGIMPNDVFDEWQQNTQQFALADYYARRRWYITSQGLTALGNNFNALRGTAAEIGPFLRDGLLD